MKRRKWDADSKARIVLAGLEGAGIRELCRQYEIRPSQYYKWKDQFLNNSAKAFEAPSPNGKARRLEAENARLKRLVGELTLELNRRE
jgi:transposase-like protein